MEQAPRRSDARRLYDDDYRITTGIERPDDQADALQSNPQTADSNNFQAEPDASPAEQQKAALPEFEGLASALSDAGIDVVVFDDTREPHTPDSVFPNNWVSFHADGTVVLYPMEAENRRSERRADVIEHLHAELGFQVREIVDLSHHEADLLHHPVPEFPPAIVV